MITNIRYKLIYTLKTFLVPNDAADLLMHHKPIEKVHSIVFFQISLRTSNTKETVQGYALLTMVITVLAISNLKNGIKYCSCVRIMKNYSLYYSYVVLDWHHHISLQILFFKFIQNSTFLFSNPRLFNIINKNLQ